MAWSSDALGWVFFLGGEDHFSAAEYLERTFDALASHTALQIRAQLLMVNGYDYKLRLLVDGGVAWESPTSPRTTWDGHKGNVCGGDGTEWLHDVDIRVAHYGSSATIRFTSTIVDSANAWGVNDIKIALVTSHPSPPAPPSPPGTWAAVAAETWPGATGWTSSVVLDASTITTCGTLGTMIGGFGKFSVGDYVEKTYGSLPTHTGLRIRATLIKIDKWDSNELQLHVDSGVAWQSTPYTTHGQYICGDMGHQQGDQAVDVDVTIAHTAGSVTIRFTSTLTNQLDYWGLQDVAVYALNTL